MDGGRAEDGGVSCGVVEARFRQRDKTEAESLWNKDLVPNFCYNRLLTVIYVYFFNQTNAHIVYYC